MNPVSTSRGPPGASTMTVLTWPPGSGSRSNTVTRCSSRSAYAADRPLMPEPTIAMSIARSGAGREPVERQAHALAGPAADPRERTTGERCREPQQPDEADVGGVIDPGAGLDRREFDLVDREHAAASAEEHHPAVQLELVDLVVHGHDPAAHPH